MSDNIRDEQWLADIRSAAQGQETEWNLEAITRKEQYYADIITALKNGGGGGGFTPTTAQLAAMNSGITAEKLQEDENNILRIDNTNISKHLVYRQGGWLSIADYSGASTNDSTIRINTDLNNLTTKSIYIAPANGYKFIYAAFDSNNNLIDKITSYSAVTYEQTYTVDINYIRIGLAKTNDGNITPSDGGNITIKTSKYAPEKLSQVPTNRNKIVQFNVMTFNTGYYWNGETRIPTANVDEQVTKLKTIFAKNNPTIIGLQEAPKKIDIDKTIEAYNTLYANRYSDTGFAVMSGDLGFRGDLCVASEAALFDYKVIYYSGQYVRAYSIAQAVINDVIFIIVNTHLALTAEERASEITELITALNNKPNVIITGDFNVADMSELTPFTTAGYKLANGGWFGNIITYPTSSKCIDNIIVSPNIHIDNVWTDDTDTIDHSPLIAQLSIVANS